MRARIVVAGGLALVALTVGCSSNDTSTPSTTAAATTTTGVSKSFAVDTPQGEASLSLDGKLPPGWPSSFPLPAGATAAGSGSLGGSSKDVQVAVFTVNGKAEDAYNFYKSNSSLTVSDTSSFGLGNSYAGKMKISGTYTGSVSVVGRNDSTYLVVVLEGMGSTSGSTPAGSTPGTATTVKVSP